jgi:cation:H+ antiporter
MEIIKIEVPVLFAATLIFNIMCLNGVVSTFEGVILLLIFFVYIISRTYYSVKKGKLEIKELEELENIDTSKSSNFKSGLFLLLGLFMLIGGAQALIRGAVFIASKAGIPELVVGLTIVAVGTSLPELFTSIVASVKNEADISIGNVLGSNFFNIFFILGFLALFSNIEVGKNVMFIDNWLNLALILLLFPLMISGMKINRAEGVILIVIYVVYIFNLYFQWLSIA